MSYLILLLLMIQTLSPAPINFKRERVRVDGMTYDVIWDGKSLSMKQEKPEEFELGIIGCLIFISISICFYGGIGWLIYRFLL